MKLLFFFYLLLFLSTGELYSAKKKSLVIYVDLDMFNLDPSGKSKVKKLKDPSDVYWVYVEIQRNLLSSGIKVWQYAQDNRKDEFNDNLKNEELESVFISNQHTKIKNSQNNRVVKINYREQSNISDYKKQASSKAREIIYLADLIKKYPENLEFALSEFQKSSEQFRALMGELITNKDGSSLRWLVGKNGAVIGCEVSTHKIKVPVKYCEDLKIVDKIIKKDKFECHIESVVKNRYLVKVVDIDACLPENQLVYAWNKKRCVQLYQDVILRTVDNKKCSENTIHEQFIECNFDNKLLSVGNIFKLDAEIRKIGPYSLFNDEAAERYFGNDNKTKHEFFKEIYNNIYIPCLKSHTQQICKDTALVERDNRFKLDLNKRSLIEKLKKYYIDNHVITLDRDLVGFHYAEKNNIGLSIWDSKKKEKNKLLNYSNFIISSTHTHKSENKDTMGWGMYFANDPVSTKEYGEYAIQVNFKKGEKFLDLRNRDFSNLLVPLPKNKQIFNELLKNCRPNLFENNYSNNFIHKYKLLDECRDIFKPVFSELGVRGILYNYVSMTPNHCPSKESSYAFVVWNTNFSPENVTLYKRDDFEIVKKSNDFYENVFKIMRYRFRMKDLSEDQKKEIIEQYNEKVLGCDLKKHPNDAIRTVK